MAFKAVKKTFAIVTGTESPRGIGRAICNTLIRSSSHQPLQLWATSPQGTNLHLLPTNSHTEIHYPALDITSDESVKALVEEVTKARSEAGGESRVVLINNAGVLDLHYNWQNVKRTLVVNYRGTLRMCQSFIPLIGSESQGGGRIVNLSSFGSVLASYSKEIQARFRDEKLSLKGLEEIARDYEIAAENGTEEESGFVAPQPGMDYAVSKACVNAFVAILARETPGLVINSCCPGWVNTEMGSMVGALPKRPEDAAKIPIHLGFGNIGGVTGRYWANDDPASTEEGKVQIW